MTNKIYKKNQTTNFLFNGHKELMQLSREFEKNGFGKNALKYHLVNDQEQHRFKSDRLSCQAIGMRSGVAWCETNSVNMGNVSSKHIIDTEKINMVVGKPPLDGQIL